MRLKWNEELLVAHLGPRALGNTEHDALAGAVDIGVEDAHPRAFTSQRQGQVGSGGGLAHAALAGGHGDDVLHVGQRRHLLLGLVRLDYAIHLHIGTVHAVQVLQRHLQHLGPAGLEQVRGIAQFQAHADLAALDVDFAQATGADRVMIEVGIGELAQGRFNLGAGNGAHGKTPGNIRANQAAILPDRPAAWSCTREKIAADLYSCRLPFCSISGNRAP
ncbi:hypothetical protein D9M69_289810 [compost metagenome]